MGRYYNYTDMGDIETLTELLTETHTLTLTNNADLNSDPNQLILCQLTLATPLKQKQNSNV